MKVSESQLWPFMVRCSKSSSNDSWVETVTWTATKFGNFIAFAATLLLSESIAWKENATNSNEVYVTSVTKLTLVRDKLCSATSKKTHQRFSNVIQKSGTFLTWSHLDHLLIQIICWFRSFADSDHLLIQSIYIWCTAFYWPWKVIDRMNSFSIFVSALKIESLWLLWSLLVFPGDPSGPKKGLGTFSCCPAYQPQTYTMTLKTFTSSKKTFFPAMKQKIRSWIVTMQCNATHTTNQMERNVSTAPVFATPRSSLHSTGNSLPTCVLDAPARTERHFQISVLTAPLANSAIKWLPWLYTVTWNMRQQGRGLHIIVISLSCLLGFRYSALLPSSQRKQLEDEITIFSLEHTDRFPCDSFPPSPVCQTFPDVSSVCSDAVGTWCLCDERFYSLSAVLYFHWTNQTNSQLCTIHRINNGSKTLKTFTF